MRFRLGLLTCALALAAGGAADVRAADAGALQAVAQPLTVKVHGAKAAGLVVTPYTTRPGDTKATKLLVFSHGHGERAEDFRDVIERVAATTGAAVIAMDSRGPVGGWNIGAGADDTLAAVRAYRKAHPGIRLTVAWGWSMGGLVGGTAVADARKLFDVWVASFPATNTEQLWTLFHAIHSTKDVAQIEQDAGGCTPKRCRAAYVRRSPMLRPRDYRGLRRVILLHGTRDITSPFQQSVGLAQGLRTARVPTTFYRVDSNVHGRGPVADLAERVVDRVLLGHEPLGGARYRDVPVAAGVLPPLR